MTTSLYHQVQQPRKSDNKWIKINKKICNKDKNNLNWKNNGFIKEKNKFKHYIQKFINKFKILSSIKLMAKALSKVIICNTIIKNNKIKHKFNINKINIIIMIVMIVMIIMIILIILIKTSLMINNYYRINIIIHNLTTLMMHMYSLYKLIRTPYFISVKC